MVSIAETQLRRQAHPNFVRWCICNGNPARVLFARALGASLILLACGAATVLTLSAAARGFRALAAITWLLGVATLFAANKGMCVVLHGMHHRQVRPWELFDAAAAAAPPAGGEAGTDPDAAAAAVAAAAAKNCSFESFGSANSYEDEPWVNRYRKRNVVRKVFDREVWIQEPALRQIQDTIFVQGLLLALIATVVLTAVFVVLPSGGYF